METLGELERRQENMKKRIVYTGPLEQVAIFKPLKITFDQGIPVEVDEPIFNSLIKNKHFKEVEKETRETKPKEVKKAKKGKTR